MFRKKALGSFNLKAFHIQKMNFSIGFNKQPPYFLLPTFAGSSNFLRKEVIQPQVPLRLPCYDLVPITEFIFGA